MPALIDADSRGERVSLVLPQVLVLNLSGSAAPEISRESQRVKGRQIEEHGEGMDGWPAVALGKGPKIEAKSPRRCELVVEVQEESHSDGGKGHRFKVGRSDVILDALHTAVSTSPQEHSHANLTSQVVGVALVNSAYNGALSGFDHPGLNVADGNEGTEWRKETKISQGSRPLGVGISKP